MNTYDLLGQIIDLTEQIDKESLKGRMQVDFDIVDSKLSQNRQNSIGFIKKCIDEMK